MFQQAVQPGSAQAGYPASFVDVTVGEGKQVFQVLPLAFGNELLPEVLHRREGSAPRHGIRPTPLCSSRLREGSASHDDPNVRRKMVRVKDRLLLGRSNGTFQCVEQLPNIAGPVIGRECFEEVG